ncbi:autotransporter outer membrane beta-barrel domain-containing protein [Phascolarctobacterium sp.]
MKKSTALSKKIAQTLLSMSLVYSGGMFVACNQAAAAVKDQPFSEEIRSDTTITDDLHITGSQNMRITYDSGYADIAALYKIDGGNFSLQLNNDIRIDAGTNYALYGHYEECSCNGIMKINPNGDKTIQLIGNVMMQRSNGNSFTSTLWLNNEQSYLAGDIKLKGGYSSYLKNTINFKLNNGAVWYPAASVYTNAVDVDSQDADGGRIMFDLDGGFVDICNTMTSLEETPEVRSDAADRSFTIKNVGAADTKVNNVTFRIGSDISQNKAGSIHLEGSSAISNSDNFDYKLQVGADPGIEADRDMKLTPTADIVVATVDGTYLRGGASGNTTFTGMSYIADINGGLTKAELTPTIANNSGDDKQWLLTGLDVKTLTPQEGKGAALLMAETATAANAAVAAAWRADNNDLLRRMGDLRSSSADSGAWARIYGGQSEVLRGVGTKLDYKAVQAGYDRQLKLERGRLFTGAALSYLDGDTASHAGSGDVDSTMFGLYSSYVGEKGHFADFIVKYGHLNNKISYTEGGNTYSGDYSGNGLNITAEYGYRQNLKNDFYIEPQAEMTYSRIGSGDYTMRMNGGDGARVHNAAYDSLIGRVGFTLGRQYADNNVYLKLSAAHEFSGDIKTTASYGATTIDSAIDGKDTWLEYGVGFNNKLSKGTDLYGEIERTSGSVVRTKWRANVGLRYSF